MEHELTYEIILDKENVCQIKSPADLESQNNNIDFTNSSSIRNNHIEESKEIATKRTTDLNNPNLLANIAHKQDTLAEELESLRETVIKMQEEIRNLTNNYNQLKSETTKPNKNDVSAVKKNDLLKNYATTTPNKVEKNLKMKKSEVINTKTPLSKTTINLKPDNQEAEKIKDDRMYRTLKSNTKDLKKTNTDKSIVRKTEKKGDENNLKKSKLAENSATFSTDAKEKEKEKISLHTKIKKPLNGGGRTQKDKLAIENESKKYLTEKSNNKSNVRMSLNEKLKDNQEKDEKYKKTNNKEPVKPTPTKKHVKKEKENPDQEKKKKEEVVDSHHTNRKEEPIVNPFPDQTKNAESEVTNATESVRALENHPPAEEKSEQLEAKVVEEKNTDNGPAEVDINLAENTPLEDENSGKQEETIPEGEN